MKIDFGSLKADLDLYQDALDLRIPNMADDMKIHMMEQRRSILRNLEGIAPQFLMAFAVLEPENEAERLELDTARAMIKDFATRVGTQQNLLDQL